MTNEAKFLKLILETNKKNAKENANLKTKLNLLELALTTFQTNIIKIYKEFPNETN